MAEESPKNLPAVGDTTSPATDPVQQELFPSEFAELMAVERQRLEVTNRRTDVMKMMVEANDAADKRQYEFQMAQLTARSKNSSESHVLLRNVLYLGGAFISALSIFLVVMLFFGSPEQRSVALSITTAVFTGLGGAGVLRLATEAIRKLMQKPHQ